MPVAHEFNPDMVLISAGFDSASGDPLGACEVTPEGFYNMTQQLMVLAKGRVVLALEGGYNLNSISNSYLACMQALLGDPSPETPCGRALLPETLPLIEKVRNELKKYWPVLGIEMKVKRPVPPTPAPSLSAEEISKLVMEKDLLSPSSERKGDIEELEPEALKDLVGHLSKLSTGERVGSPYDTEHASTSTVAAAQQAPERLSNAADVGASVLELEMKEIGEDDVNVILELSRVHSATQSGTSREPKGGDRAHRKIREGQVKSIKQVDTPVEVDDDINAKSWGLAVKGGSTDTVDDLSSAEEALPDNSGEESGYIWYLCYGSNMWKPRFMCYISGGQVEGMSRACQGCRDTTPPLASEWLTISNALFFGHESTHMWGLGGVAFLDPIPEDGISTITRLYKITKQQFNDVFSQENREKLGKEWVNDSHIDKLRVGGSTTSHLLDILEDDWYGTLMYLGEKDGLPILTFTCSESHMEKFRSGELGTFGPSDSYRAVIARGLVEDSGISEEKAFNYLLSATLPPKHS